MSDQSESGAIELAERSDERSSSLPESKFKDFTHLLSRPRVGPWDQASVDDIVELLETIPDWPTPDQLTGPAGKTTRAVVASTVKGTRQILNWLLGHPGDGWQQRWLAAGGDDLDWVDRIDPSDTRSTRVRRMDITRALSCLIPLRVVFVSYDFLTKFDAPKVLARSRMMMGPEQFERFERMLSDRGLSGTRLAGPLLVVTKLVVFSGNNIEDLTCEDLFAMYAWGLRASGRGAYGLHYVWELLSELGITPVGTTLQGSVLHGQRTSRELVNAYGIRCESVREVIIRYLDERRPALDYTSLLDIACILAGRFWADLESHHPGIASLHLPAEIGTAWKQRLAVVTDRTGQTRPRLDVLRIYSLVRAFYLDIQQWALEDPSWAEWAVPSPITRNDIKGFHKLIRTRRAKMHQRIRDRLPQLPVLVDTADRRRRDAAALLEIADSYDRGQRFEHGGIRYQRTPQKTAQTNIGAAAVRITNLDTGETINLSRFEDEAFWGWAIIETLRHTGIRIEELLELTHLALVSYQLPDTGEVVPLLQIVPSKSNEERLLLISPELASVLATIITRLRGLNNGSVRLVPRYDNHEKTSSPPLPHLFQRWRGGRAQVMDPTTVRRLIDKVLAATGLVDAAGEPMAFKPHDFRRMFATDIVTRGLPVHIAARLLGHASLDTTQVYLAVFQEDLIRTYRSFLTRRRDERPSEEYREPTEQEWTEFQQHFQARKLELGECGRPYGSPCSHEHACIRCPMLRVDPRQQERLTQIMRNLTDRIHEATMNGWLGEAQGLETTLKAARAKLASLQKQASRNSVTALGIPAITVSVGSDQQ